MSIKTNTEIFFRQGDIFVPGIDNKKQRYAELPPATYVLRVSMELGYHLQLTEDFVLPPKLYGTLEKKADRILTTFESRPGTTGVLLCGEKGSGKTLLTKLIATKAQELGMPTILVNFAAAGDSFNEFLSKIDQPAVVLFDEFEKTYDDDGQQALLTLLDGVFTTKKLCLLTSNEYGKINGHMKNRPGRIFYYLNFEGLDAQFVTEYGADNLKNPTHLPSLQVLSSLVRPLNFDMLKAVVEESNRYNEAPMEALEMLNVTVSGYADTYDYVLTVPGRKIKKIPDSDDRVRVNPLNSVSIGYYFAKETKGKKPKIEYDEIRFLPKDLIALKPDTGYYEYQNEQGATLKLTLAPITSYTNGIDKVKELVGDAVAEDDLGD